jgi:DHA1 family multidrug resistance protein-like MFS transporter
MWDYLNELKFLPSGVKRFIATEAFFGLGVGIFVLTLNLHILSLGFDEVDIGKVTSFGNLLQGVVSIPAGILAAMYGRKRMLLIGLFLMGLGIFGFGTGMGKLGLYVSQSFWSAGMTFLVISEIQLLFQYCKERKTEFQAYGLLFAMFTLFSGIGTLLGGYLPRWLGGVSTTYENTLYIGAISIAICLILRGILLPSSPVTPVRTKVELLNGRRFRMPSRKVWLLSTLIFLTGCNYSLLIPFFNIIVKFRLNWSDESVSLLLTVTALFNFAGSLVMPYIRERWSVRKVYVVLFILNIFTLFLLSMAFPTGSFITIFVLRGGMFIMLHNMLESESMSVVPEEDRDIFAALRNVFRNLGGSFAALSTGFILSIRRYDLPFLITGVSLTITIVFFMWRIAPLFGERKKEN